MLHTATLQAALRFAEAAHRGRLRPGTSSPFVLHPVSVAMLLAASGADDELVVAGLLHDVVEDEDVTLLQIAQQFGERVGRLVSAVTEPDTDGGRGWRSRKERTLADLAGAEQDVLALKAADLCANIAALVSEHEAVGEAAWQRFDASPPDQAWYYQQAAQTVLDRLRRYSSLRGELASRQASLRRISQAIGLMA